MKKQYIKPILEKELIELDDVIAASTTKQYGNEGLDATDRWDWQ